MASSTSTDDASEYVLHYWTPAFKGRAEFVRLLFEAAGVPYKEVFDAAAISAGCDLGSIGTGYPYPAKAPPIVTGPDGYNCSQTPAILHSLGKKFDLFPDNETDENHCLALNITLADFIAEGRASFHAQFPVGSYSTQVEETKPRIEWFVTERLPKWLNHLEHCLQVTPDNGASYFFGGKLTYCDLAALHVLNAVEAQFKDTWTELTASSYPLLVAFKARMMSLPKIKAYHDSDRSKPWAGDSMM